MHEVLSEQIQNFLPKFIHFPKNCNEKRGTFKFLVNKRYSMVMTAWQDSKPVHLLSTADSTKPMELKQKHHGNYIEIECLDSIKKYHLEIGGVDCHNKLISLFSVGNHIFKEILQKNCYDLVRFYITEYIFAMENG